MKIKKLLFIQPSIEFGTEVSKYHSTDLLNEKCNNILQHIYSSIHTVNTYFEKKSNEDIRKSNI